MDERTRYGGSQLISGLTVSASGGGGDVRPGLLCKEKEKGLFKWSEREKRETLFADLCASCGTVKRLYVKTRNVIGSYNFHGFNGPGPAGSLAGLQRETERSKHFRSVLH